MNLEPWNQQPLKVADSGMPSLGPAAPIRGLVSVILVIASVWLSATASGQPAKPINFNQVIRPILSDNCFFCHGPDRQQSELRLDNVGSVLRSGVIEAGDPDASELFQRISSNDPDYQMPPPDSNRRVETAEVSAIEQWITEGADLQQHWAFRPVPEAEVPEPPAPAKWSHNPIDAFVLRRLREGGIEPNRAADRETLLRRVTLDLTGLPPTLDEIDDFLADASQRAFDKVVDRLLNSPAYGERMAMQWLDVARFADTFGYDNDREIHMWPWRDWVIRSFNHNLPYDRFIRKQIAGDLLPSPAQEDYLATGFNRLHRQNAEGGALPEEFAVEYVIDRVHTFGTAFLGLTLKCARCHDHKFDPISQRDFYSLYAYFGNIDEAGVYAEKTGATPTPNIFLYDNEQRFEHNKLKTAVRQAEVKLQRVRTESQERFEEWVSTAEKIALPEPIVSLPFDRNGHSETTRTVEIPSSVQIIPGRVGDAALFDGDTGIELKDTGRLERTDPFTFTAWLRPSPSKSRMVVCHNSNPVWEAGYRGFEWALHDSHVEFRLSHMWPGNAIGVRTKSKLPPNQWTHVAITYDGSSRANGIGIYLNAIPASVTVIRDTLYESIRFTKKKNPMVIGARHSELGFKQGRIDEFALFEHRLTAPELFRLVDNSPAHNDEDGLLDYYQERIDKACAQAKARLRKAREAENTFTSSLRSIMVMRDKEGPASAFVLERGEYDRPGEEVKPNVPPSILPPAPDQSANRLGLAEWLLRRDHPLTARVAVNRIWRIFFGRGLVETLEDFGSQGKSPSHPDLLDYLAATFMKSGWNVKALCRTIVSSATYRQDSTPGRDSMLQDPKNFLMGRGPRHRLEAEAIRDLAIAASGLISDRVGGASVKPYQPAGLWKEAGPFTFEADSGANLHRRSMYTFWKRTVPPPTMINFDAVNREVCVARRDTTITPIQALTLLNDPQFVEASRALATLALKVHGNSTPAAIEEAFRRLTGRRPRLDETEELLQAYAEQQELFANSDLDTTAYLTVGDWRHDSSLNQTDLAAMTAVVQLLMNHHEVQTKQ